MPQDFEAPDDNEGFEFIHRVIDGADFYFVSNQSNRSEERRFSLPRQRPNAGIVGSGHGRPPRFARDWSVTDDGRIRIPMTFEPYQSFFVVFRKPADGHRPRSRRSRTSPSLKQVAELTGPWTVAFDPKWGGPEKVVFEKLDDWTKRPEEGIKYLQRHGRL